MNSSPKNALGAIAILVGIVEIVFAYPVTQLSGAPQITLVVFMVTFPTALLVGLFYVLIKHPENFYSPTDFQDSEQYRKLVSRRDKPFQNSLNERTKTLEELSSNAIKTLGKSADVTNKIFEQISRVPQLNQEQLDEVISKFEGINDQVNRFLKSQTKFPIETLWKMPLTQIDGIFIKKSDDWSLSITLKAVTKALIDIEKTNLIEQGGSGEIELYSGGDFKAIFSYDLKLHKYNEGESYESLSRILTISFDREYCTVS